MASVNKVILIGNLGADPEVRYTSSGRAVANLRLATTDTWTGGDGVRNERTEWHRVVVWGKSAESAGTYLRKGRQVYIEGRIQSREYQDREGQKRTSTEVVADRVKFLGGKREEESGESEAPARDQDRGRAAPPAPREAPAPRYDQSPDDDLPS